MQSPPRAKLLGCTLVIMAKAPRPGMVKTRLAQRIPVDAVTELYRCLLDDTVALAHSLGGVEVAIMCPASDVEDLTQLAQGAVRVSWRKKARALRQDSRQCLRTSQRVGRNASLPSTVTAHICRLRFFRARLKRSPITMWLSDQQMMAAIISSGRRLLIQRFSMATAWALRVRLRPCWRALADCNFPLASRSLLRH